jgi:hypothetical protein
MENVLQKFYQREQVLHYLPYSEDANIRTRIPRANLYIAYRKVWMATCRPSDFYHEWQNRYNSKSIVDT